MNGTISERTKSTVKVFKDHPAFDHHAKWWMLPAALSCSLYVCTYTCDEEDLGACVAQAERDNPDCVLVY